MRQQWLQGTEIERLCAGAGLSTDTRLIFTAAPGGRSTPNKDAFPITYEETEAERLHSFAQKYTQFTESEVELG